MPIRSMLFDFDGTLADSFAAITASTNHVRQLHGLPPMPEADVQRYVGYGLDHLLRELVPHANTSQAVAEYREHHPSVMATLTRLFPGVVETLTELRRRGITLAICSNKRVEFTKQLAQDLHIAEFFGEVLGPDDVGVAKPDPAMLNEAMRRLGSDPTNTVYVGDMIIDVRVARAAKVPVWILLGGAAGHESPLTENPDRVLERFGDIVKWL
jgi:2-phosphoglycolate phosphatase